MIAQILDGRAHWIPQTTDTLEEFRKKFATDIVFVEVTDDVQEGWEWDGTQAVAPTLSLPTKNDLLAALDADYLPQFQRLDQDAIKAKVILEDMTVYNEIMIESDALWNEYFVKQEAIEIG